MVCRPKGGLIMDFWHLNDGGIQIERYTKDHQLEDQINLKKVTESELLKYRHGKKPGLAFVVDGNIYYSPLDKTTKLELVKHKCCSDGDVCRHLSALPDELGGCPKVRDLCIDSLNGRFTNLKEAKRIEKYDFITLGYETFNIEFSQLVVLNCSHYEPTPPRRATAPVTPH